MQRSRPHARWATFAAFALVLCGAAAATSQAPRRVPATSGGVDGAGLWISDSSLDDGRRQLIVIDPVTRHAAVYHVDPATGSLGLKSARDLSWDLSLDEFNVQEPRPAAIRRMVQPGQPPSP
ncbi:MAG: hypothetical protein ACKOZU_04030 [Planctomycetaceae bacterium]